ncbi:MAG: hypothetical protein AAF903_12560 [Pseudomonadota bacterium]
MPLTQRHPPFRRFNVACINEPREDFSDALIADFSAGQIARIIGMGFQETFYFDLRIKPTRGKTFQGFMQLRNKSPKRRVEVELRKGRIETVHSKDVTVMNLVRDQLVAGRTIRILTVNDTFSRCLPVVDPLFCYKGTDAVSKLDEVCVKVGYSKATQVDNGSEFVARDMDLWAH